MTVGVEQLLREAERLSNDEREDLALKLLDGLERDPGYDEAWAKELQRRIDQIDSGDVEWIPGEQVLAMIDAAVRGERRLPADPS